MKPDARSFQCQRFGLLLGLLMSLVGFATAAALPDASPGPRRHIVTGILENQWDGLVKKSLWVEVYAHNHCIGKVASHDGMFHMELSDRIAADMPLTILVRGQVLDHGHRFHARRFSFAKCVMPAADSQNIVLKVKEHYLRMRKSLRHRYPVGRTLYINEI
jgi:hypothetical protein